MDSQPTPHDVVSPAAEPHESETADVASQPYIGRWNQLISTTNWEKGRIILEWRSALIAAEAPTSAYSDEAWAQRVGGVTGQHVGRLRRVAERFGEDRTRYADLYWSHFQAALDWNDAEMWLEGAAQNNWSVSRMRATRRETLGEVEETDDASLVTVEVDEDFDATEKGPAGAASSPEKAGEAEDGEILRGEWSEVQGPAPEGPDFGDEDDRGPEHDEASAAGGAKIYGPEGNDETMDFVRPFENLAPLPEDLAEAFESFKLAILRHKSDDWQQVARDDVLATLDALKTLAAAPSNDPAPF